MIIFQLLPSKCKSYEAKLPGLTEDQCNFSEVTCFTKNLLLAVRQETTSIFKASTCYQQFLSSKLLTFLKHVAGNSLLKQENSVIIQYTS